MHIVPLSDIQTLFTPKDAIDAVKKGIIAFSEGLVSQPEPMQILFPGANNTLVGDCHAKAAQWRGHPYFVIKVATGFYHNEERGLPVNNGMVMVFSSQTGVPVALLQDDGWLTQMRTAAAGALAASLKPKNKGGVLGIIGTGTQALLQARFIADFMACEEILIFGRSPQKADRLVSGLRREGFRARPMDDIGLVMQHAQIIVTTTPALSPIITEAHLAPDCHIVAVGADSPGKCEIAPEVMAQAQMIVTDSHVQALDHGDFGVAVRHGKISADCDVSFGSALKEEELRDVLNECDLSVVDLTGLGVQDLALASLVMGRLG